jgi:hypothetical protein
MEHKVKKKEIEQKCLSERGREILGVDSEIEQKNRKLKDM